MSLGKSPLPSSPSVSSSNAAESRSPSGQSDWLTHGGNTLGPLPSTLTLGDYNKLLVDTKRLMSTHQLPYVAKLTTDSSGEDSDKTNLINNTNDSSKESTIQPVITQSDESNENEGLKPTTTIQISQSKTPNTVQVTQQATAISSEPKVLNQLPPLSPPSIKKLGLANIKSDTPFTSDTTIPSNTLIINGTKYQPAVSNANLQQRPGFLASFPRPSSACGSSPVPYARPSSKTSPMSSSPKPFSSTYFKPIANSLPFNSSTTPTRHNFTPSPKILETDEPTSSIPNNVCAVPDGNSMPLVRLQEYNKCVSKNEKLEHPEQTVDGNQANANEDGLNTLLNEVDERIRFSLDIDSTLSKPEDKQQCETQNASQLIVSSSALMDTKPNQAANDMKYDLSQVKKDISELKNELTVTKQGLENGKQPLFVSFLCLKYKCYLYVRARKI